MEKVNLEKKLDIKNVEVGNLQQELKEVKVQFAEIKSKMEDLMLKIQKNQEIDNLKSEIRAEVKKDLVTAVEKGLRDLPYEMVCAYRERWTRSNSVVSYDRITMEFNNSDRPGGGDGTMNIETGVFAAVSSGHYIITTSGIV